jgi:hypothetical protein
VKVVRWHSYHFEHHIKAVSMPSPNDFHEVLMMAVAYPCAGVLHGCMMPGLRHLASEGDEDTASPSRGNISPRPLHFGLPLGPLCGVPLGWCLKVGARDGEGASLPINEKAL